MSGMWGGVERGMLKKAFKAPDSRKHRSRIRLFPSGTAANHHLAKRGEIL
jgi:hypothetical protein